MKIGATSFRYGDDGTTPMSDIKLKVGRVIYCMREKETAAKAIEYATGKMEFVWCDTVSVSFLRKLDKVLGKQAFDKMGEVYKFYTCVPSLNWMEDPLYRTRAWMLQEYICGELLVCDSEKLDKGTLLEILEDREEKIQGQQFLKKLEESKQLVLQRKPMSEKFIGYLLDKACRHFEHCGVTREEDLPNACFGLLQSYGLFDKLPEKDEPLSKFANYGPWATELSLHPFRLIMRLLVRLSHEKNGVECAVQFANKERNGCLEQKLTRGSGPESGARNQDAAQISIASTASYAM
jgi:hypothetical protein